MVWQFFCSVKLAVYTLVLLAATSVIGTVIIQNGPERAYVEKYGQSMANLIKVFGFNDMYHAPWFLALIVLLCINIVVCSIERLSVTWKVIFPKAVKFNAQRFRKIKLAEPFELEGGPETVSEKCRSLLSKNVGKVIVEPGSGTAALYAENGRWTRIGVYIVHASILLLLVGALIGALFGFKANMNLDEGEASDRAFLVKKRIPVQIGFQIRCNDFEVKFYDTGAPEEFRSNLTIIENGVEVLTTDIRVNHPLRYKGINIFQSSYGTAQPDSVNIDVVRQSDKSTQTHKIKVGQEFSLPDNQGKFKLEGFLPNFDFNGHNLGEAFVITVTPSDGEAFQLGLPIRFPTFDRMRKGDFAFLIKGFEQKHYTGLQVTKDPGVWYVYTGFILMIIGCWVTFFMSHQSYFIEIEKKNDQSCTVFISGTTNRNKQGMKLKINKLINRLKEL